MKLTEKKEINKQAVWVAGELNTLNESYRQAVYSLINSANVLNYLKNLTKLIEHIGNDINLNLDLFGNLYGSGKNVYCFEEDFEGDDSRFEYFITLTKLEYLLNNKK